LVVDSRFESIEHRLHLTHAASLVRRLRRVHREMPRLGRRRYRSSPCVRAVRRPAPSGVLGGPRARRRCRRPCCRDCRGERAVGVSEDTWISASGVGQSLMRKSRGGGRMTSIGLRRG
jgi:hypothetical protein